MNAIFLGSFDPPHIGHANVIMSVINSDISKLINNIHIIPTKQNPNKKNSTPILYRYYMSKLMFEQLSTEDTNVIVNDIEFKHDWTYTYDMLEYLANDNDKSIGKDFLWIITRETYGELINNKWYKSEDIFSKYITKMIIVGSKPEMDIYPDNVWRRQYIQLMPGINIHSTDIRNLIKQNKNVELYFNNGVYNIIKENNLYGYKK
jgi:nicotinate-nucleotide adenylyltransferase